MIIFLTQLSTVPKELKEAAMVDGATGFQIDIHVYLPMMKPAVITNIMPVSYTHLLGVCIQRIKEIRSGEEDDLSKY